MPERRFVAAAFVAAFLAVQLAIPALALFGDRPGRFGWHMYSALPSLPDAWVILADGSARTVNLEGRFALARAEVDYDAVLRTALCAEEDVTAVRIAFPGQWTEVLPCD